MNKTWMFFILFSPLVATATMASYTINDLIILSQSGEHQEFIDHAKDIKPTKRDKRWKKLVSKQANLLIDELRTSKNFSKQSYLKVEKLALWSTLKTDEFFHIKRNSYALMYFKSCFISSKEKESCSKDLKSFWPRSNKDPDTGHKLSLLLRGFTPKNSAWPIVKDIIVSNQSEYYCSDLFIQETVHKKISTMDLEKRSPTARKMVLQSIAHLKCWNKLIPYFKKEITLLPSSETTSLYFSLVAFNQMTQIEKDLWLTMYLLDDPRKGPLLNMAWNNVKELSQNFERRIKVLEHLKALSPLPGDSFNNSSLAITRHFNKYFPEYISAYAKTCLSYLEGTRNFKFGNPTLYCDSLFKRNKYEAKNKFLDQSLSTRYSAIKSL
jgi:hypothetical protein